MTQRLDWGILSTHNKNHNAVKLLAIERNMSVTPEMDDKTTKRDAAIDLLEQFLVEAEKKLPKETPDENEHENEIEEPYDFESAFTTARKTGDLSEGAGRRSYHEYALNAPRKYHLWPVFIVALAVFVLLTGGLTYFNRTVLASQADEQAEIKRQGNELLDESLAFIQEADMVVIALDTASESRLGAGDIPVLEALLDQIDSTQELLDNAIEKAEQARYTYTNKSDKALAQYAIDAAEYRKTMLVLSAQIADYDIKTIKSALLLEQAWNLIVDADMDMRTAVEMVAVHGANGVVDSRNYNERALYRLTLAQQILGTIPEIFPEIDLSSITNYLTVKIQSAQLALDSDNYYLDGYYTRAKEKNEEFKIKDLEVVELALKIPAVPMTLVISAYDEVTREIRESYKQNRSEAADIDAYLRAYLGITRN